MVEMPAMFEPAADEQVSDTVIRALADTEGVDPTSMDVQLYDAVDPDALDAFFGVRSGAAGRRVSFSVGDYRVAVDESRCVHVMKGANPARVDRPAADTATTLGTGSP